MHGREWISSSVVLYVVRQLVENYEKNKRLVDNADWYLLPVANPDGYEYSHTTDRLWTKTRSDHDNSAAQFTSKSYQTPKVRVWYWLASRVQIDVRLDAHSGVWEEGFTEG